MQPKEVRAKRRDGRPKINTPSPVDVHVGSRIRLRRTLLGLSQEKLGTALGLTFQQVQKYERGANRVGASRLYDLSRALDVSVAYFFEEVPSVSGHERHQSVAAAEARSKGSEPDPMAKRETLDLVRAYYRIPDAHVRRKLFDLAKALGTLTGQAK